MSKCIVNYKIVKCPFGGWYYELWGISEGKTQQIRPGNTPYKTKREMLAKAQDAMEATQHFLDKQRCKCFCCGQEILMNDAVVVGEPLDYEYWCQTCIDIWNSWL